jgi:hypothetical protein
MAPVSAAPRLTVDWAVDLFGFSGPEELDSLLPAVPKPVLEDVNDSQHDVFAELSVAVNGDNYSLSGDPLQNKVRATLSFFLEAEPSEPTYDLPCR